MSSKVSWQKIWRDTINAISTDEGKWSAGWFVKPVESKKFTGKVISSIKDLIGCGAYNEDLRSYAVNPLNLCVNGVALYTMIKL